MKNYKLLSFDETCGLRGRFLKNTFFYPVAYTDGVVSRLKSKSCGRTPWGIVIKGYIVSINPPKQEMTHSEAIQYSENIVFAGIKGCILPRGVLVIMMRNLAKINQMMSYFGKQEIEAKWYMAYNDTWLSSVTMLDPRLAGVHPHYLYTGDAYFFSDYEKGNFFPAIKF